MSRQQQRRRGGGGTPPTTLADHQKEVAQISQSVRSFYDRKEKFRIFHGSTNSTRKSAMAKDPTKVVDTSRLNHVVSVDTEKMTALVQPNVSMDRLVEETLKYGLVPPVVMEFPGITVGGGFSGTSGESSSFKHGFFDRTLNSVEMVLATGQVITASENEHADLFRGAAGAVGTLGVTTLVEINLHPAKKFVETTYHPVTSMQDAITKLQDFTCRPQDFDYIDGIMFSPTSGAIITGQMTNTSSSPIRRFSAASDPWFYLHVQSLLSSSSSSSHTTNNSLPISEAIPLPEYLFRYDRGGFWVGKCAFDYFRGIIPFNKHTRRFLDDFLSTRMLYNALHASGISDQIIVQDLALPYETAAEFVETMDELTGIWPLWLCPLKQSPGKTMHPHLRSGDTSQQMLNIGLWGRPDPQKTTSFSSSSSSSSSASSSSSSSSLSLSSSSSSSFITMNRKIETTLQNLGGMKWLYAQTYSTPHAFWQDFDKTWYDSLRAKYHATTTLPTVYEKVRGDDVDGDGDGRGKGRRAMIREMWPFAGIVGLRGSILSRDYLKARNAAWKEWVPRE